MKFTIITPCRNAEHLIGETIESVLDQTAIRTGRASLEYLICDGGSTDRTAEIASSYRSDAISVVSEPDRGMYDAIAKGLRRCTGDIVAYLNAGDFYNEHAFEVVLDIFETIPVQWLTGCMVIYNDRSQITYMKLPFKYRRCLFASGMYGRYIGSGSAAAAPLRYLVNLGTVQQESTFWSSSLNSLIDLDVLARLRYAGDFYLWSRFATAVDLNIVESHLGGFKYHHGQLSENISAYGQELRSLSRSPRFHEYLLAFCDRILSHAPSKIKKQLNRDHLFRYDHRQGKWA